MRSMTTTLLAVGLLSGCAGWNHLPDQGDLELDSALWNPSRAKATVDGLYVPLTYAGGLALIPAGKGEPKRIDLGEGRLTKLTASPDRTKLVAFVETFACDEEDPKEADRDKWVDDCPNDFLKTTTALQVIQGDEAGEAVQVDGTFNAIQYADDGQYAIAYLDFSDPELTLDGVINLTSVVVLDLTSGVSTPVSVGFAADRVLFTHSLNGEAERAVVLSQNEVAVIDLTTPTPTNSVTFPLTLDPDSVVTPVGIQLTPDGRYALISVAGSSDLYALDLLNESINIVELSHNPTDMAVNTETDRTVLVYNSGSVVDVLEHEFFDLDSFSLDEPMSQISGGSNFSLLWSDGNEHDAYRLDLETNNLVEYRLQNPAISMHIAPTEEFAIALTRPENGFGEGIEGLYDSNPGMEVIDLQDDETEPFLLEGTGLGVSWAATEASLHALILQETAEYVYKLDMYTGRAEELELSEPPMAIGNMTDGTFFITHNVGLGLVTFLDPVTNDTREVSGFATLGLADPIELLKQKGGK